MKKPTWKTISIILLPIQIVFFLFIENNENWIENYYSRGFFKSISLGLRWFTGFFNFSIGLVLVYFLSVWLIVYLAKALYLIVKKKLKFRTFIYNSVAILSPIYFFYMLTWGLAYHKKPLEKLLNLDSKNIQDSEIIELSKVLVDSANSTRTRISQTQIDKLSFQEIFEKAPVGYQNLKEKYSFLKYEKPSIKKAFGSNLLSYMSTSGIYMFPTGEANVNTNNVFYDAPYVTTHEMAHQLGFASEEEASYLAFLACKNNPDPVFQYSAYYGTVFRALNKVWEIDSTQSKSLFEKLSPTVKADLEKEKAIWKKFRNPIQKYIVSPFYDLFLKSNGQEQGSRSYDLVVELMVAERRKAMK